MTRFPLETALTIAALGAACILLPRVAPALKGPGLDQLNSLADFKPERMPLLPFKAHAANEIAPIPLIKKGFNPIFEDTNGGLDHFYAALWKTERKEPGAVTRVTHYGDSPTTADLITGDIRAQLQQLYGDAGHGYVLLDKPWAWYQHRGVSLTASGWLIEPATHFDGHLAVKDRRFGLGGVSFKGGSSASTRIELQDHGQSEFELYYLQEPGAGMVSITSAEKPIAEIETSGDVTAAGFAHFSVPGGATRLELHPQGKVNLYGLTAEKLGPGVVYDSLGLNGASITILSHMFNQQHWTAELQQRNPNLVVINYGTNEADFADFIDKGYERELREVIRRVHAALPNASVLVMSPMDRGYRIGPGEIETMPTIPKIVAVQRRVAQETRCGFFDTFMAMGGAGTMARWYASQPRLVSADFIHPNPAGGKIIATVFVKQIELGFARYKLQHAQSAR